MHENANGQIDQAYMLPFKSQSYDIFYRVLFLGLTGLMNEFIRLAKTDRKDKFHEANKPVNQVKNRYKNVYPYDDTRVKLSMKPGVDGSDYINANYVDSYMFKDMFIASQAPLKGTIIDFWRMIWEQNSQTVVMLSKEYEGGQVKKLLFSAFFYMNSFGF